MVEGLGERNDLCESAYSASSQRKSFSNNKKTLIFFIWPLHRTADGKLHLLPEIGKIPFVDATLIEDPTESGSYEDDDGKKELLL